MDLSLIAQNILNPPILFFFLGMLAVFLKSDLTIPQPLPKLFSLYLLIAIGFVWHFLPTNFIKLLQKGFDATPLIGKAVVLAFVYWIVYATASAGPQPFIYFQF